MWLLHALCIYLILFRCGVYRRLLLFRSFHNLHLDKRNRLHTFCFIKPVTQEPSGNKIIFKMEKQNYVTPEVDVIEVEIEKGFAASNEDPEDGGWITSF